MARDLAADRAEIDKAAGAFLAAFDNRAGRRPDMAGLRALFADGAVIVKASGGGAVVMTVETFIAPREALLTGGALTEFHEWEETSHTALFGGIAWRQCTYRKAGLSDGRPIAGTGVKAMTFVQLGGQWRIASVAWQDEEDDLVLDGGISF